ncbi:DUF7257 domain-containing protein [Mycobacteroides immunogenum]|uniref:DUF7257 domain-containing protein n=1 Tax=Mycobacteroides immunogenum TaxID=83262 RepID=A0A7V8LRN9_9MYCO|nr:hypothetical protein [Mycobacteroides immunogenum]AMT72038.1 hypothetical protein ABG82_18835 [Mycobacteroides immunogenum]ANO05168.1 hypothetical protein BAB75_19105 [Mycobacteroides immunogenum]KIU40161.1 hypothetical protein TL11_12845 [Mycobacteroides immunogenum]KPG13660.1 hypothetical protein AN909_05120 [Mycobacteroides immunogenum]KPG14419.1 hypothetical protein AN908_07745 [Mycobacteroides immunogenum]
MSVTIRYPANPVTPHGWYHLVNGEKPMMRLTAYDGSVEMFMLGGYAIPDPHLAPEAVHVVDLEGLIAPWKHVTQKGATEDGVLHVDAFLDPVEVKLTVKCRGRNARATRRVYRHLIDSLDAIKCSRLDFFDQEAGYWWADVRWFQGGQPDPVSGMRKGTAQKATLRLQADTGTWKSFDHADAFTFTYDAMTDTFAVDHRDTKNLGNVPQHYSGTGGGYCTANGDQMIWVDDPDDLLLTTSRRVINGPWPDFDTDTDNQVISQVHGGFQEWSLPDSARNILGGRMNRNPDGSWAGDGVFVEYGAGYLRLYYTINFVETTLRVWPLAMVIPPMLGEKFTLVCGYTGNLRTFKFLRNGLEILSVTEPGTGSPLGPDHRGIGNGAFAASAVLTQATPAPIRKISAGDNAEIAQTGFLKRINIGDQDMYDDYTLFGPFTKVKIYDGPGSGEYVEFGPLLPNQVVLLRTDPRVHTTLVQDLTSVPPSPQELDIFQDAIDKFMSFAGMNGSAFAEQIESLFGIRAPQGPLYKYLTGRFSKNAAIPAKSPGNPAQPYFVKVSIEGGNADSKIIASGTPRRRYPL